MPVRTVPVYGEQPACGTLLAGRYRLRVPIGSGGTADVFRGTDEVLGREVAVKVFRAGSDTATPDSFCDEARTLARLSHRALVTVYDFDAGRQGQGPFMVTELIRGATLRARIAAGPLSAPHVTRLGAEIASALDHVHSRGIVHHDVKPSNVFLNEAGSPHLADFGLSRTVHDRSLESSETLVGTLAYMAPEQFLGQPASTASDIYALGLTLLEALTGHREYQGTPVEVGTAHLLHGPQLPEDLPGELGGLLAAMTDQDPLARPDAGLVHLRLRDIGCAPVLGAAPVLQAAQMVQEQPDMPTHRTALASVAAARSATRTVRPPASGLRRVPSRRRASALGIAAAGVAGACALLVGGLPAGERTPPAATFRNHAPEPGAAEAPVPRPAPSAASAAHLTAAVPPAASNDRPSATPAGGRTAPQDGDHPGKGRSGPTNEGPGKSKGSRGERRSD
ncbi:serine/threonine-protein kinase [Streptomyces sp. NPDC020817]|uniref:serine/threonine-protein kinase n=1 Tax=Streptomyces sp. NPDC020817 TaxID=3365095 RepID=UPI0037A413B8